MAIRRMMDNYPEGAYLGVSKKMTSLAGGNQEADRVALYHYCTYRLSKFFHSFQHMRRRHCNQVSPRA